MSESLKPTPTPQTIIDSSMAVDASGSGASGAEAQPETAEAFPTLREWPKSAPTETVSAAAPPASETAEPASPAPKTSRTPLIVAVSCAAAVLIALIAVFTLLPAGGGSAPVPAPEESAETTEPTSAWQTGTEAGAETSPAAETASDYILPESNSRYYTADELRQLSIFDMYLARNEIFARHGRIFSNQDLRDHFGALPWYNGTIAPEDFSEGVFNEYERANADLLLSIEQSLGSPYVPGGAGGSSSSSGSSGGQTIYDNEYFSVVIPAGDDPDWWTVTRNPDGSSKFPDLPIWVISNDPPGDDNGGSATITVSDWKLPDSTGHYGAITFLGQTSEGLYVHSFNEAGAGALNYGSRTDGADLILH